MSKIQIRKAKISDIPSLVDKLQKFYGFLKRPWGKGYCS